MGCVESFMVGSLFFAQGGHLLRQGLPAPDCFLARLGVFFSAADRAFEEVGVAAPFSLFLIDAGRLDLQSQVKFFPEQLRQQVGGIFKFADFLIADGQTDVDRQRDRFSKLKLFGLAEYVLVQLDRLVVTPPVVSVGLFAFALASLGQLEPRAGHPARHRQA